MNLSFKIKTVLSSLLLFVSISLAAQDQSVANPEWGNLKKSLSARVVLIQQLTLELQKSEAIDRVDAKTTQVKSEALQSLLKKSEVLTPEIKTTNRDMTQSFTRLLVQMEQDPMLKANQDFGRSVKELNQFEEKFTSVVKAYNDECTKMKREDLRFE
ncbi:LemA family protein [Flavobacterium sp.]|uniref:LemA family protein n=1 Tax=Flavobacterium sp. TaxID=239 RepID=UPI0039E54B6E